MTAAAGRQAGSAASSSSTAERFRLDGPSRSLDPRFHAYRRDLAHVALAGRVITSHYARPLLRSLGAHPVFIRPHPDAGALPLSELLPGEEFAVLEYASGWAWGYCPEDGLVGYVEAVELTDEVETTHIVCEPRAPVTAADSITAPILAWLPMGSRLAGNETGACLATEYGCVPLSHLRTAADPEDDPVHVAERLVGTPFLAGGRTCAGIDAAGLIQLSLTLCGFVAPRICDALREFGKPVPAEAPCRRGDLVLGEDLAGLMVDDLLLIHASSTAGKVTVEPLALFANRDPERRRPDL